MVGCRSQKGLSGEGSRSWAWKTVQGGGEVLSRYGAGKAQGGGAVAVGLKTRWGGMGASVQTAGVRVLSANSI